MKVIRYSFFAALMLLFVSSVHAKTWTIGVRSTATGGYVYTMNGSDLTAPIPVSVGDTLDYEMDFSLHNLGISNSSGALILDKGFTSFGAPGGTSIKFVVPSEGSFGFACSRHANLQATPPTGMVGAFTATAAGVAPNQSGALKFQSIFPNPSNNVTMVDFELTEPAHVKLLVYDAQGKLVLTALDEQMSAGTHMPTIDTKSLASGSYQYVLQAGDAVLRRQAIIVR
jgi:plastocyanin